MERESYSYKYTKLQREQCKAMRNRCKEMAAVMAMQMEKIKQMQGLLRKRRDERQKHL